MKKSMINIRKYLLGLCPSVSLLRRNEIIFPYYHSVNDEPLPHISHLYAHRDIKTFCNDLDAFLRDFIPITLEDVIHELYGGSLVKRPSFHLTFDDGFRESYDVIAPILKQKGIPATFFVCTDFIDNKNMYFRNKISILFDRTKGLLDDKSNLEVRRLCNDNGIHYSDFRNTLKGLSFVHGAIVDEIGKLLGIDFQEYLKNVQPYLTSSQVKSLLSDGFAIGSHSMNHPLFQKLTLAEQADQVKSSLDLLQKDFNCPYRIFAFPHTDSGVPISFYNKTAGYTALYFGTGGMVKDCVPKSIQRFSMENRHLNCEEILKQNYLLRAIKRLKGQGVLHRNP